MKNNSVYLDGTCLDLLAAGGVTLSEAQVAVLDRYVELVHEWNPVAGLVSLSDAENALPGHLADSLSLVPLLAQARKRFHLDIGSGGGFPALPLAVCLPEVEFQLMERSMRKCGFLVKAVGNLALHNVSVEQLAFPAIQHPSGSISITARAVERPGSLHPQIARWMRPDDMFLNQSGLDAVFPAEMFHVEQIKDEWSNAGLRRGDLAVIARR